MMAKIIGLLGVIIYLLGTHLAMYTFYKPFQYWWHYYSDLGYLKNSRLSRSINFVVTVLFSISLVVLWMEVSGLLPSLNAEVVVLGTLGAIALSVIVIIPYDKYLKGKSLVHGSSVIIFNFFTNLGILLVNYYINSAVVWIHLGLFIVYFIIYAISTTKFRHDLVKARPYHAPVQKIYAFSLAVALITILFS